MGEILSDIMCSLPYILFLSLGYLSFFSFSIMNSVLEGIKDVWLICLLLTDILDLLFVLKAENNRM